MDPGAGVKLLVRDLRLDDAPAVLLPASTARRVADDLGAGVPGWVAGVVEAAIVELLAGERIDRLAPWEEIRAVAQTLLIDVLRGLVADGPALEVIKPAMFYPRFDDIVARLVPVAQVLETVAAFQRHLTTALVRHALRLEADASVIASIVDECARIADFLAQLYAERYVAESARMSVSTHARTRAGVEAAVAGRPAPDGDQEPPFREDDAHLGCVIGTRTNDPLEAEAVRVFIRTFAAATRARSTVHHDTSNGHVWVWAVLPDPPRLPQFDDLTAPPGLQIGIGLAHHGWAGVRRTHIEALDALRLARAGAGPVVRFSDVALVALLSADVERAQWFVQQELGELHGDGADLAELRHTLRVFYGTRMRVAPAADQLFLHRNSLINRLERIQRLLGHPVTERTAEAQAALLLRDHPVYDSGRIG